MRIAGNTNIGNTNGLSTSSVGVAALAYVPIVQGGGQLRTDSFERSSGNNGQVVYTEQKTIVRKKDRKPDTEPKVDQKPEQPATKPVPPVDQSNVKAPVNNPVVEVEDDLPVQNVVKPSDVPPAGTTDPAVLAQAPNPKTTILGKERTATIIIDLSTNILYKYDKNGNPEIAYRVASGKKSTPTEEGIRLVTHTETYPYKSAPAATKRRQNPQDYGPKLIGLAIIDPKTGAQRVNGEFIHGNNNPSSIGKYASKGCIRMDNEVIKVLSQQVKRGDVVIIKRY